MEEMLQVNPSQPWICPEMLAPSSSSSLHHLVLGWILVVVGQVLGLFELLVVVMVLVELLSIVLGAEDMDFVQLEMMEAFDLQDELLSLMG